MRFTIKHTGCGSERVGCLTCFKKSSDAVIETPTSALLTQGGSVVHLTAEVLLQVFSKPQLLWVPLSNSVHLETGVKAQGEGVAKFAGLHGQLTCVTLHNMNEMSPLGHFEQNRVPLWTKYGKKMITAERYMDVMEVFKPDLILAIADGRTSLSEGNKRISKSVDRTCNMLDICVKRCKASEQLRESSLIGVLVGTGHTKKSMDHILTHKQDIGGVVLAGITDGTEESMKVSTETLKEIFQQVDDALPKDLVRIIEGCWNPAVVVAAIEHGWDMFDGSYPLKLTNAGHALTLNFHLDSSQSELCILDLNDERYKEDFGPILKDCECLACKKHTRAYIRHLLNTREMLSSVLLSIHNLHHFDQFFHHARQHISLSTFPAFKNHITKQYDAYKKEEDLRIQETKATEDTSVKVHKANQVKKIRVSKDEINNESTVQ